MRGLGFLREFFAFGALVCSMFLDFLGSLGWYPCVFLDFLWILAGTLVAAPMIRGLSFCYFS